MAETFVPRRRVTPPAVGAGILPNGGRAALTAGHRNLAEMTA